MTQVGTGREPLHLTHHTPHNNKNKRENVKEKAALIQAANYGQKSVEFVAQLLAG